MTNAAPHPAGPKHQHVKMAEKRPGSDFKIALANGSSGDVDQPGWEVEMTNAAARVTRKERRAGVSKEATRRYSSAERRRITVGRMIWDSWANWVALPSLQEANKVAFYTLAVVAESWFYCVVAVLWPGVHFTELAVCQTGQTKSIDHRSTLTDADLGRVKYSRTRMTHIKERHSDSTGVC